MEEPTKVPVMEIDPSKFIVALVPGGNPDPLSPELTVIDPLFRILAEFVLILIEFEVRVPFKVTTIPELNTDTDGIENKIVKSEN